MSILPVLLQLSQLTLNYYRQWQTNKQQLTTTMTSINGLLDLTNDCIGNKRGGAEPVPFFVMAQTAKRISSMRRQLLDLGFV